MPHQATAVAKLLPVRVGALFMDMGTGKTRTVIELARLRLGRWDRVVWFCPVSLKETTRAELLRHTDMGEGVIHVFGDEPEPPEGRLFYIIGIESMSASSRVTLAIAGLITDRTFVVVDESSYIKGHRAKRTQRITALSARSRYRVILTGTPFTQGAVDLYAQMKFLSERILGYKSFWSFANNHLEYEFRRDASGRERRTGRIVRSHNVDWLAAKIAPYTYQVRKDECLTLPEKLHESRVCQMTSEQWRLHEQAKEEMLALPLDDWSPIRIFRLFTALQTIACGFWNRTDESTGEVVTMNARHRRLDLLADIVRGIPTEEPVIVWAKYRAAVEAIVSMLSAEHGAGQVARFDGALNEKQREAELQRFRAGARFLVATQSTGGHGLTLNEAAYAIFYADSFRYAERAQAEDRNHRIGQARRPVYIAIECIGSIDSRIAAALARKGNALRSFQDEVEQCRHRNLKARAIQLVRSL